MLAEKQLIDRVLSGDKDAFRPLVERYHKGLCIYLVNIVHDEMQAEDLAQEAFVRAYERLETFDKKYSFSTWLYRIARNLALRHLEVRASGPHLIEFVPEIDESDITAVEEKREIELKELKKRIQTLRPEYQEVINLYYWNEKSYAEIAVILNCPVNTVRIWLMRAKEVLRKDLNGQAG